MTWMNVELYKRIENRRREEMRRDAAVWRLLREQTRDQPSWLKRQGCWLLCQLGRWLVSLGRQLQAYGRYTPGVIGS